MFGSIRHRRVAFQTLQELTDALRQIWEDVPQDTIHRLIRSRDVVKHAHKHKRKLNFGQMDWTSFYSLGFLWCLSVPKT